MGLALILTASVTGVAFENLQQPVAPEPASAVVLHYEKETKPTPEAIQLLVKDDGSLLLPIDFKGSIGSDYTVTVLHC